MAESNKQSPVDEINSNANTLIALLKELQGRVNALADNLTGPIPTETANDVAKDEPEMVSPSNGRLVDAASGVRTALHEARDLSMLLGRIEVL